MKNRFIIPALIVAPLALFGVAVASSPGHGECGSHGGPGGHRGPPIELVAMTLGLDDGQTAELEALRDDVFDRDELRAAHEAFRLRAAEEFASDAPDFDQLEQLALEQAETMHAAHLEAIRAMSDFAQTLTPEQRATVAQHLENGPPAGFGGHHRKH